MHERAVFAGILWSWLLGPAQSVGLVALALVGLAQLPPLLSEGFREVEDVMRIGHLASLLGLPLAIVGVFVRRVRLQAALAVGYWLGVAAVVVSSNEAVERSGLLFACFCGAAFPFTLLPRLVSARKRRA